MPALPRPRSSAQRGLAQMYLAVLLWGTVVPAMQLLTHIGPTDGLSVGFFRLALAIPALALASWRVTGRLRFAVTRRDLALMLSGYPYNNLSPALMTNAGLERFRILPYA